jgi:hypothetical protein
MSLWTHDTWKFVEVLHGGTDLIIADDLMTLVVLSCCSGAHRPFNSQILHQPQLSRADIYLYLHLQLSIPAPIFLPALDEDIRKCKHLAMHSVHSHLGAFVPCVVYQANSGGSREGIHMGRYVVRGSTGMQQCDPVLLWEGICTAALVGCQDRRRRWRHLPFHAASVRFALGTIR